MTRGKKEEFSIGNLLTEKVIVMFLLFVSQWNYYNGKHSRIKSISGIFRLQPFYPTPTHKIDFVHLSCACVSHFSPEFGIQHKQLKWSQIREENCLFYFNTQMVERA